MTVESIKILIVDDFRPDCDMIRWLLSRAKMAWHSDTIYECASVFTGNDGLAMLQSWKPDCILLDYNLPDMQGLEFISSARQSSDTALIPIIVLTGASSNESAVRSFKEGALDYIIKGELTSEGLDKSILAALSKASLERQLQDKHEELTLFAARTSHDLISPLNNILMYVELLGEDLENRQLEAAHQKVGILNDLSTNTLKVVKRLGDYARHGRKGIKFMPTDLNTHVTMTSRMMSHTQQSNAHIEIGELPTVMGDPVGLSLLFQNLFENGLKFCTADKPRVSVSASLQEDVWLFAVQDNGIGIERRHFDEIFRPFARVQNRNQLGGSGLGLATCRKILWQHGGEIWVESQLGEGSTFYFTLPREDDL